MNKNQLNNKKKKNKKANSWVPVVYACNPSYSEGRDQEDCGYKPAPGT
jgi:hypothetical protein